MTILLLPLLLTLGQDHAALGAKAIEEQKFEEAIGHFQKAVAADASDYYSWFHLGLANSAIHKDPDAIASYRKTLALKPNLYQAELNLGIILVENRQAKEAIPLLADAVQQKPQEFRPAYYLAEAYLAEKQFTQAEAAYRTALGIDGKSAVAQYGLARSLMQQGKLAESQPEFVKAGQLDPGQYGDAVLELAAIYEEKKQVDAAMELYRQYPQVAAAQERLGVLLLDQGKPAEAIAPLEIAVSKSATAGNSYALAQAYMRSGKPDKALALIDRTIAAEPKEAELYMIRGRLLRDQRRFQEAANTFFSAAKLKPENVEAWTEMAGMLVLVEDYATAIAALDKVKQLNAETSGHFFLRAIVLDKNKMQKPALEAYQKFLASSGGKHPDQEFQARQRVKILEKELSRK
ncbi:hypothetical protein F183_A48480 [Bryobacterales bacterium F-183]|nr:hypothetical protein F183_A48480 [Bryobacterales bacterium F-183]